MNERYIYKLEQKLNACGFKEIEDSEEFCFRRWEKSFDYQGRVYHGKGRIQFTIWDYSHLDFVIDPYRVKGTVSLVVEEVIKAYFDVKLDTPWELEEKAKKFLDGEFHL